MRSTAKNKSFSFSGIKIAFLASLAISLNAVEELFLPAVPLPGVSFGLNNAIFLVFLNSLSFAEIAAVQALKVFVSALLFKGFNPIALFLSASGALSATAVLAAYKKYLYGTSFTLVTASILMAVFHLTAQIAAASLLVGNGAPFVYLPVSGMAAVVFGTAVGVVAGKAERAFNR